MLQDVKEQMPSPLQAGQSVLTLACGHLWSWNSFDPPPTQIDCTHCDRGAAPMVGPDGIAARLLRDPSAALKWAWPEVGDADEPAIN